MSKPSEKRQIYQLGVSAALVVPSCAATYYAAFLLRFAGHLQPRDWDIYLSTVLWVLVVQWLAFVWFRLHQGWTRFVGFHDLLVIGQAVTCGSLGVTLVDTMCLPHVTIPRSIVLIDWGATMLALGALRATPRVVRHGLWHAITPGKGTPSLIVGANDSGEALLRATRCNPTLAYRVIGFVDDRKELQGRRIRGVPVLGTCDKLPQLVARFGVEEVLITSGELPGKRVRRLIEAADAHGFRVKVLPSYEQLLGGQVAVRPRQVAIEDLLCRESVQLDLDSLRDWIAGRVVMVTGSAGSIGSEICRQLLHLGPGRLVPVDRAETGQFYLERELIQRVGQGKSKRLIDVRLADLTDYGRLAALFEETSPEIVFHAAAYKHVPLMESHCGEAIKNIVLATRNLVDLAEGHAVRSLVMISTDKAVKPTSVMGSCKRLAEQYVQARSTGSGCRFITVRFGNVLDSSGSVVPIFREQIARGGPVTVTHPDIIRYFMLIPEAAQLVIQAGAMGKGGEIFVLDMGEPVRIMDLAHDLIRLSGLRVGEDIEVQITGLRPGEKLFEELYDAAESHQRTAHPKIVVAESSRRNLLQVIADIRHLEAIVEEPNEVVREALAEIIPIYGASGRVRRRAAA
jgi:FlaA1/EpsC-like NDP-sugar epimerase